MDAMSTIFCCEKTAVECILLALFFIQKIPMKTFMTTKVMVALSWQSLGQQLLFCSKVL